MNPVLHGTLKRLFAFLGNLIFWPLTMLFVLVSGWKQALSAMTITLVAWQIAKKAAIALLFPVTLYWYLGTGLIVAVLFSYLFGTFKNAIFVYPTIGVFGVWLGIVWSLV